MSTDALTLGELQKLRSRNWQDLIEEWKKCGLQVDSKVTSFDAEGTEVSTEAALVCSEREKSWARFEATEGKVIASPLAELVSVAIQEQGLPSKLYIAYRGRILFERASSSLELRVCNTCYRAGTASVGTAVHPSV